MKLFVLAIICLFSIAACDQWAVLVAGSNTFNNYRHQADVYHAYQILKKNGFSADRIITFAYDDIASSPKNPIKGKVFNKPTYKDAGVDVYNGVVIDYKGANVDPAVFLHVLEGNKTAVKGLGSGRVLESTSADNVFLFFSDHGAPGLIAFPSKYLYAKDLITTFNKMSGRYNKLVFYLEACESGSMFTSLANNTKIYALSAANPSESSWGTYCAPDDVVQGKHIGSCLGDLFSVNFLENTEVSDLFSLTLDQQFSIIKQKTTKSQVMQWGDRSFVGDYVSDYLSKPRAGFLNFKKFIPRIAQIRRNDREQLEASSHVNSRTIKLQTLISINLRQQTEESMRQLVEEARSVQAYNSFFGSFKQLFSVNLQDKYDPYHINFECLKESIDYYESKEGKFSDYGLQYIKYIAKACETVPVEQIKSAFDQTILKRAKLSNIRSN